MPLNITILGLDYLGAALGLAFGTLDQDALPSGRPIITGWDADKRTLRDAHGRLMIDREARDAAEAVRDADIVIVTRPEHEQAALFDQIAPHLKYGAIVTDTSSTKTQVIEIARAHLPTTIDFIGGHPLLSVQGRSQTDATMDTFKGAIYCIVMGQQTRPDAPEQWAQLITAIGAKPYYIDAAEHDAYVAGVYHLPLIAASALIETISRSPGWREMQSLAGSTLQTATELATIDPTQLAALCSGNQAEAERWINDLIRTLVNIRDNLANTDQLDAIFTHAHEAHEQWSATRPNMRPGEADYYGQQEEIPSRGLTGLFLGNRKKKR